MSVSSVAGHEPRQDAVPASSPRLADPSSLGRERLRIVVVLLVLATLLAVLVQLLAVAPRLSLSEIGQGVTGAARGPRLILLTFRAPRIVVGAMAGAAFGVSGALVQRLMRNPLASPDVLGISSGASLAALVSVAVLGWTGAGVSLAALAGAVGIVVVVLLLSGGSGRAGQRFILIGVAMASAANALIAMLTTTLSAAQVGDVLSWLSGSLAPASWQRASWLAVGLVVLLPLVSARRRSLEVLEIDADVAGALGSSPQRDSRIIIGLAVALSALATAAAGPISFIAFVSGPLSRLLLRGRASLVVAGATGAALTLLADAVAQLLPQGPYPVGIVTGAAGAPFLLWVLLRRTSQGAAA